MSILAGSSSFPRRTVFLLMVVVACGHFNRVGMSVAGSERIMPEYGIDPDKMGLVYAAFLLFYALAMLPGGWFIDRFGARTALILLGCGSTLFVALTGAVGYVSYHAATVWMGLLIVRSMLGIVNAPLHPASARTVFEHAPAKSRMMANGMVTFAACAGISVAFYAMGMLIDVFDWPAAFLISSGLTLIVAVVWTAGTQPDRRIRPLATPLPGLHTDHLDMLRMLRSRSVVCITLSYTALNYFQYLFFYWIEYYFETIQHQDRSGARGYSTMITLSMGVGMVSGGWLADRVPALFSRWLRRALVPVLGMIGSGIVFDLGLLAPNIRITLVAFAIAAALIGACEGIFWTTVVELGGRFGGTAAGLMNTGGNAGGTLSPYLTPLLGTFFTRAYGPELGWRMSLAVAGGIAIAGAALWIGIHLPRGEE